MRITITGGNGFLGKCVVENLRARGYRNLFAPNHSEFDLTKYDDIQKMYDIGKPDIVIHLAAIVGGIGANISNPGKFFYNNLMMGAQMMEQGRQYGLEKFVAVGSICSYPKFTPVPFKEEDIWNGYPEETNAPYGLAKKMLLVQSQAFRTQYWFKAIYFIPTNLYGSRDSFDLDTSHVIPALIEKIYLAKKKSQDSVTIWGNGQATREFLYVEDGAEGIILATERYDKPEPVNLGSGMEISIKDLVNLICKLMDSKGKICWDTSRPDGQPKRRLDTSKAKKEFNFKSTTKFEEGLKKTINYYEENYA